MKEPVRQVLWKMRGPRRVIVACLVDRGSEHELVVFFEDNERDVIESQSDSVAIQGLVDRAATLREMLTRKGLSMVGA